MNAWAGLILMLLVGGAALVGGVAWMMARVLVRPPRMTDAKANWLLKRLTPGDLGLAYQEVSFTILDARTEGALKVAAWWIPQAPARGTVVLVHGYADAKVGAIAWAPLFHDLGWNLLALDLRGHGESEGSWTSAGYWERHDLSQVIDQLRAERPEDTKRLALFGASMGAAVAAGTAAVRDDVEAIILESPYADFRSAARTHFELLGVFGAWVQGIALWLAARMVGARFEEVRPGALIKDVKGAVMVVVGELDPFLTPAERNELEQAVRQRGRSEQDVVWRIPDVGHLMAVAADSQAYGETVNRFLEREYHQRHG